MELVLYSLLHFLTDGVCAFAMAARFIPGADGYLAILIYNFCAFALQMPLGALLDILVQNEQLKGKPVAAPYLCSAAGVLLTICGVFLSPAVLGIGNALFHIGGGVAVIREDGRREKQGVHLGIFVAPGAMGLYLGRLMAGRFGVFSLAVPAAAALMLWLTVLLRSFADSELPEHRKHDRPVTPSEWLPLAGCFLVVVLRSYVGLSVEMPWKTTALAGLLAASMVVGGKMLGGLAAAKVGALKTAMWSLTAAGICFWFCRAAVPGLSALLLFNMTMPITLHRPVRCHPQLSGFFFGLLTLGIFFGFLPVWLGRTLPLSGALTGAAGCALSALLLLPALLRRDV